jgi:hypothetical protein
MAVKKLVKVNIKDIRPYSKNEKVHTNENLNLIRKSLETVGYISPIVVDENFVILAGHGRYEVMKSMEEYATIEVIQLLDLSEVDKSKFRLYDNQSSRTGHYDNEFLVDTIKSIMDSDDTFNISILGIDGLLDAFSTVTTSFDLGKAELVKKSSVVDKSKVLLILDEVDTVSDFCDRNSIKYFKGYEYNK